jgi:hypothetical protein
MTKSKGIKRPDWIWTDEEVGLIKEKYATTSNAVLEAMIGCTASQLRRKAVSLSLIGLKSAGSILTGKSQSREHSEAISRGMKRAFQQGRLKPPSDQTKMAMMLAARHPDAIAKSAKTRSKIMKGRAQRMDGRSAAAEHNARSKKYTVLSPDRVHYTFTNLKHFVRENAHMFSPEDVIWKPPLKNPWCRASCGLYSLFKETKPCSIWKGWRAVSKSKACDRSYDEP